MTLRFAFVCLAPACNERSSATTGAPVPVVHFVNSCAARHFFSLIPVGDNSPRCEMAQTQRTSSRVFIPATAKVTRAFVSHAKLDSWLLAQASVAVSRPVHRPSLLELSRERLAAELEETKVTKTYGARRNDPGHRRKDTAEVKWAAAIGVSAANCIAITQLRSRADTRAPLARPSWPSWCPRSRVP